MRKILFILAAGFLLAACGEGAAEKEVGQQATEETSDASAKEAGEDATLETAEKIKETETTEAADSETVTAAPAEDVFSNFNGNTMQGGQFLITEDKIFFPNFIDGEALYSMNLDGSNQEKLTEHPATNLHMYDGWIYYTPITPFTNDTGEQIISPSINRIKADGSGEPEVIFNEPASPVQLTGDALYFIAEGQVKKYDLTEQSTSDLPYQALMMSIDGDTLVYYNHSGYHLGDVDGELDEPLFMTSTGNFAVDDDYLYYSSMSGEEGIYRYSLTNREEEHVIQEAVDYFNVKDGHIYYSAAGAEAGRSFYRTDADGQNKHDYETILYAPHIYDDYLIGYFARQGAVWYPIIDLDTNEVKEMNVAR